MEATATRKNVQLRSEAASVKQSVAVSQAELANANKLRPDIESLRLQLTRTTDELSEQKKLLSSSEEFAKKILSSRVQAAFAFSSPLPDGQPLTVPTLVAPVYGVLPPALGSGVTRSVVYMLLPSTPIANTLQLQFHAYAQPAGGFVTVHNLVIFSWGDPLPKFTQPDADFRGNKWMR